MVWGCWLLKEIGGKLKSNLCEVIINRCSPYAVLLAIDLSAKGLVSGRFPKRKLYDRLGANPMLGNDWLLSYEAERSFGYRLKVKNRTDYSVFGDLISADVKFYDADAQPFVFQGIGDIDEVDEALEDHIGLYDDEDYFDDDDDEDFFDEDSDEDDEDLDVEWPE